MATIEGYTNEVIAKLRLPIGEAELAAMYLKYDLDPTKDLTADKIPVIDYIILSVIPQLLLLPDKTNGGTSLKWDRSAVLSYYRLKCAEYGFQDDQYIAPSEINDLSYMH